MRKNYIKKESEELKMELTITNAEITSLEETEKNEIDKEIDRIINQHKNNRYEVNRLVFESVAALTQSENYSNELNSQGILKRFWGGITGKNRKLQQKISQNLAAAQYASQQTLQKLAEQNLMSFELITAVNNKLNSSIIQVEREINNIYGTLVTFFKQAKSDIIQLENRVEKLERNVKLLNWQNSIEYQIWNGIEYSDLDDIAKIVCITRDFYDITKAKWTTSDLLLLKSAMSSINISPRSEVSYRSFIFGVSKRAELIDKLFEGLQLNEVEKYPQYIAITAGIKKNNLLETDEKYLVDNTMEIMEKHSCQLSENEIREDIVNIYERDKANIDIDSKICAYDLILEILYNMEEIKEIQYVSSLEEKLREAEMLFSVYDTEQLIPLLEELISYGVTKAKYMMALLYETGCAGLKRDDEKSDKLLEECISEEYLPAKARKIIPCFGNIDDEKCKTDLPLIVDELEEMAISDKFACYECARAFVFGKFENMENYQKAIDYFEKSPLVLGYYGIAKRYDNGEGVDKDYKISLSYYLKAANMGYNLAEYAVAYAYEKGFGTDKYPKLAFEYYKKAYEHGNRSAINRYAWCLTNSFGTDNDYNLVFQLYKEGESVNDVVCIFNMGWCYYYGIGVGKDLVKAKEYVKRAADMGNEWAQNKFKEWF